MRTCCNTCALADNGFEYTRVGEELKVYLDDHPRIARISIDGKILIELRDETFWYLYEQDGYRSRGDSGIVMTKKCRFVQDTVSEMNKLRNEITEYY